jgi:hypothetical protein
MVFVVVVVGGDGVNGLMPKHHSQSSAKVK